MRLSISFVAIALLACASIGCNTTNKVAPENNVGNIVPGGSKTSDDEGSHVVNISSGDSGSGDSGSGDSGSGDSGSGDGNSIDLGAARQLVPAK